MHTRYHKEIIDAKFEDFQDLDLFQKIIPDSLDEYHRAVRL